MEDGDWMTSSNPTRMYQAGRMKPDETSFDVSGCALGGWVRSLNPARNEGWVRYVVASSDLRAVFKTRAKAQSH